MPPITTYSFQDLSGALAHPLLGAYAFTGEGTGSVQIEMASEVSARDRAADGSIMVSKILGHDGSITITCQQTSPLHKFLMGLYNLLYHGESSMWAQMAGTLRNVATGTSHLLTGMSFMKAAGTPYQAQGQNVSWVFSCADIQNLTA